MCNMSLQLPGLQQKLLAAGPHDALSSFLRLPYRGSKCHMTAMEACNATHMEHLASKTDISLYCAAKDLLLSEFWSTFKIPNAPTQSPRQHHTMLVYRRVHLEESKRQHWFLPHPLCEVILQNARSLQQDLNNMGYCMRLSQGYGMPCCLIGEIMLEFDSDWTCRRDSS